MSNRFRFRAWHKEWQVMYEIVNLDWVTNSRDPSIAKGSVSHVHVRGGKKGAVGGIRDESTVVHEHDSTYGHIASAVILMQCTGLKDTNGKLIFESDIVKIHYGLGYERSDRLAVITYSISMGGAFILSTEGLGSYIDVHDTSLEIVGNIYENPELMPKYSIF